MNILKQMAGWGLLVCLFAFPVVSQAQYSYGNTNATAASCVSTSGAGTVFVVFESTTDYFAGSTGTTGDGIYFISSVGSSFLQSPMSTSQVYSVSGGNFGSGGQTITISPRYNYGSNTYYATVPNAVAGKNLTVYIRYCRTVIFDARVGVVSVSSQTGACFSGSCTEGAVLSVNSTCVSSINGVSTTYWTSQTVCSNGSSVTITRACPQCDSSQGVIADTYQIVNGVAKALHYWYCSGGVWMEGFAAGVAGLPVYVHYEGDGVNVYTPNGSEDGLLQVASHGNQINSQGNVTAPNTSTNSLANPSQPQQQLSSNAVNIANMPALQAAVSGGLSSTVAAVKQSDTDIVNAITAAQGSPSATLADAGTVSAFSSYTSGWQNPAHNLGSITAALPSMGTLSFGTVGTESSISLGTVNVLGSSYACNLDLTQHATTISAFRFAMTFVLGIWAWRQSIDIIRSAIS